MTLKLGWFTTGRGPGSRRLLAAVHDEITAGRLDAGIEVVFCNREPRQDLQTDELIEQVGRYGLPLVCLSSRRFRGESGGAPSQPGRPLPQWRLDFDREAARLLEPHPFDLGVLAGYMLIAPALCERYDLLNLHPAAPGGPPGTWQEVIWQLIEQGATHSGVRMHLATAELDMGPNVTYCTYPIRGPAFDPLWREVERRGPAAVHSEDGEDNALFQEVRRHGLARELPLLIETLRTFAAGSITIRDKQPLDGRGRAVNGIDLTDSIESALAGSQRTTNE